MNTKKDSFQDKVEILVVEDSPSQAERLKYFLEREGFRITVAEDGNQALALLGELRPSLVISGIIMPGMNGYELCKRIKSDERTGDIPVILLTSLTSSEEVLEGLACGANNFITKPYSEEYLLSIIARILARWKILKSERVRIGVEVLIGGKSRFITADQQQMLSLLLSTYEAAVQRNIELTQAQDHLRSLNEQLDDLVEERTAELKERVKEIECLYALSSLVAEPCKSIDEALKTAVDLIPPGWQYPQITCARIIFEGREFATGDFRETPWKQSADIVVGGENVGTVEVRYLEERPKQDEGVFLKEERNLINDIARQLGVMIQRVKAEERDRHLNLVLRSIRNVNQLITKEKDRDRLIQGACENLVKSQGFKHAWISLLDEAGKLIRPAEYGIGKPFMRLKKRLEKGDIPLCAKRALSSPGVIVIEDIDKNCPDCPISPTYQGHISISTRLEYRGKVYGILAASLPPVYAQEKEDQGLFEEVGGDIAFALHNIEQEEKHIEDNRKIFEQEERFRAIFEGAAEGILLAETQTMKIKYTNPAMCQMLGYTEDELKHITVKDIHPPEVLDRVTSEFEIYKQENKPIFRQDIPCLKKDGTIIYTDIVTTPRIFINGIAHSATFFLDITLKKKAEKDKKEMETQLLQSQKLEAVGRLTGGIAHDFNNLLTAIIGNADIMLATLPKDTPPREGLEEIRAAGDRAAALTHQLLAFSRKQILEPVIMSLNETVYNIDKMLRRIIGEDIELRTILAPDLGLVEVDMGQLEQVIMNLAVNARDAMPEGGKLTIETANVELDEGYANNHIAVIPGRYVMLSVSDTGDGMTKEVLEQVFDPFFTTKEKGKGTGLGLSMVYGIVKQSKGNIWVYSEPGKGATFKVYLPRVEKSLKKEKKDKKPKALTGSETILIVEDDDMVRNFTVRVLKGLGYRILIAADGQEAISISGDYQGPIHLILTDVVMPGMSGGELEEKMKVSRPGIKALYMSGYTDNAIVHHGVLDREKSFLQKPFTPDSLGRKVRERLDVP